MTTMTANGNPRQSPLRKIAYRLRSCGVKAAFGAFSDMLLRMIRCRMVSILKYIPRKIFLGEIHLSTEIASGCEFWYPHHIQLGEHARIQRGVVLRAPAWGGRIQIGSRSDLNPYVVCYGNVSVGKDVMIGPHVMLAGGNHGFSRTDVPMRVQEGESKGIEIGDDVWIGANAVIVDGVSIGRGAVVGAGSVVSRDLPAYAVAWGAPAKVKRLRIEQP